jgi:hypothetical protein
VAATTQRLPGSSSWLLGDSLQVTPVLQYGSLQVTSLRDTQAARLYICSRAGSALVTPLQCDMQGARAGGSNLDEQVLLCKAIWRWGAPWDHCTIKGAPQKPDHLHAGMQHTDSGTTEVTVWH